MKAIEALLKSEEFLVKKEFENPINIAFATDSKYAKYLGVVITSILENNKGSDISFHIFLTGIDSKNSQKLKNLPYNNFSITYYFLNNDVFENLPVCGHFSSGMYYRIIIPNILIKKHINRVIYLDIDTLCLNELKSLYFCDMENKTIAAVPDSITLEYLSKLECIGFSKLKTYFNSGVILIDIEKWNKNNTFSNFLSYADRFDFAYPDQDILNILFQNDVKYLPEQYNWRNWKYNEKDLLKDINNIRIVHFTGEIKPWMEAGYCKLYTKFHKKSLWKDIPLSPPNKTREYRKFAKALFFRLNLIKALKYQIIYLFRKILGA